MRYNTVLFDADGTLFDFLRAEKEALSETLIHFGIEPDNEKISVYSEINDALWKALERGEIKKDVLRYKRFELFCDTFGYKVDIKEMAALYTDNLSTKGHLIHGAAELCKKLYGKAKLYIVTNGIDYVQKGRMERSNISECFEDTFISGVIGCEKPDIKYFEYVSDNIPDFNKKNTIIVGDSLTSDIKGGIMFGIDTCWYNPKCKPNPSDMNITYTVSCLEDIYSIIVDESEK